MQKNRQKAEEAVALRESFSAKREVCFFLFVFFFVRYVCVFVICFLASLA